MFQWSDFHFIVLQLRLSTFWFKTLRLPCQDSAPIDLDLFALFISLVCLCFWDKNCKNICGSSFCFLVPSYISSFLAFPPFPPSFSLSSSPLLFIPPSLNLRTLQPYKKNNRKMAVALHFSSSFSAT